jgi:solute:Na+ symporter, SSS family
MRTLDWIVLVVFVLFSLIWGMVKGRGSRTTRRYLLADKTMPWYAVALSIMATQASAITFLSTTGQAYADGMRFLQFYFGLPIAMVLLAKVAVPTFHRLDVYTAYQYLETRFDLKTRVLTSSIFLIQRGLAASLTLFAPALILSVVLGWDMRVTIWIIGVVVVIYTVYGGVLGVNWNDFQQFIVIMGGMLVALIITVLLLPDDVSFGDAVSVAGAMGRLNAVDFSFDWQNRYNFWSGLIGGLFLALAYFGTDQSQVQRYLTARSVTQSRMGLLFNGMAKVPMQFFILFVGAMVFVFYQFVPPPLFFNPGEEAKIKASPLAADYLQLEMQYQRMTEQRQASIRGYLQATRNGSDFEARAAQQRLVEDYRQSEEVRRQALALIRENDPRANTNDINYVFLTFVTTFLPAGLVGLIIVIVFGATMTSTSSELNALATCSVIDVYQRIFRRTAKDEHYVKVSRFATALWGLFAILVSERAARLGTLVEAVNILGSLFYGTVLGVFLLAFFFKRVRGTAAFAAAILGQGVVLYLFAFTSVSFLWYNVFGSAAVVLIGLVLTALLPFNKQTIR